MSEFNINDVIQSLELFIHYYSSYSLLLCSKCRIAISNNSLNKHIKDHLDDLNISSSLYKDIFKFFQRYELISFNDLIKTLQSIFNLKPFPELNIQNRFFVYV